MIIGRVVIGLAIAAGVWLCAGRPRFRYAWEWLIYFGGVDVFIVIILLKVGW